MKQVRNLASCIVGAANKLKKIPAPQRSAIPSTSLVATGSPSQMRRGVIKGLTEDSANDLLAVDSRFYFTCVS